MKMMSLLAAVLAVCLTFGAGDADAAKRLGGGRSTGMQREMNVGPTPSAPMATPSSPMAAPSSPARSPVAANAPVAQSKRSWMGPLAGLAAGLGLAALASHFGFGEELASMMTILLVAMIAMAVLGFIFKRRQSGQPALAGAGHSVSQYPSGVLARDSERGYQVNESPVNAPAPRYADGYSGSAIGSGLTSGYAAAAAVPAGFDVTAFLRTAKTNFIRLQAANDAANLDDLREVTTPEMFAVLKTDVLERGNTTQQTDIVSLEAQVLEVLEEPARYIASVRFTGSMREERGAVPEGFDEVWHLTKSRMTAGGWLLSGIQQAH